MLALDDDTTEFHRRHARDPLIGPAVQRLRGLRPRRKATVTHALVRAISGQLIQASQALQIERAIIRAGGEDPPTRESIAQLSPARVTACGLAGSRARTLARLTRTLDLEGLRTRSDALERLGRERGVGPWTVGVVALQGLGRYDAGLVDDLALVKLLASLRRRWPEPGETAELLEPYGEWQGLASVFLLQGFRRGLVRGASMDRARLVRGSASNRRLTTPPYTPAHGRPAQDRDPRRRPDRRVADLRPALVRLARAARGRRNRTPGRACRRAARTLRRRGHALEPRRRSRSRPRRHRREAPGHRRAPGRDRDAHPSRADRSLRCRSDPDLAHREQALRRRPGRASDAEHPVDGARGDRRALRRSTCRRREPRSRRGSTRPPRRRGARARGVDGRDHRGVRLRVPRTSRSSPRP